MSVDFTKPIATADRAQNLTDTRDTLVATAKLLDDTTPTGVATGMIRWSSTNNKFQKYNGSSWVDLASTFAINVNSFNGQAASYYTNIAARLGYTPVNKAGDTMTGPLILNADATAALGAATKQQMDAGLATKAGTSHTHAWPSITNRMYTDGTDAGDPNTATEPFMVSNHANAPLGAGTYFYIWTGWHGSTSYMSQVAVEITSVSPRTFSRSKSAGTWGPWVRCDLGEGLTRSIGANGYVKLPGAGGLILQWGRFTRTVADQGVSFPMVFPNACLSVVQTDMRNAALNDNSRTTALYPSYFISSRADTVSFDVLYQAIGY